MAVAVAEFREVCLDQGVEFIPEAAERLAGRPLRGMQGMVSEVAGLVRKEVRPLANKTIDGSMWGEDTAAATLQTIVNASVVPVEEGLLNFQSQDAQTIPACDHAEVSFTKTIDNLLSSDEEGPRQSTDRFASFGFEVVTHNRMPVLLRKSIGEKSAISLAKIAINGIPYPIGSIMRIDTEADLARGDFDVDHNAATAVTVASIAQIAFIRLATYAYRPDERVAVAQEQDFGVQLSVKHLNYLLRGDLSAVQPAAARATQTQPRRLARRRLSTAGRRIPVMS